jgi:homoaconitase/3-isopropylmalate dehydratase large subunit
VRVRARSHKHLHGASGQLAAGVGSVGGGVAVAMGGVWVTSEATALIDATLTLVRNQR